MIRVLHVSHMYPLTPADGYGRVVHAQVAGLARLGVRNEVICPIPWAPGCLKHLPLGRWSELAGAPREAVFDSVPVAYARYWIVPKLSRVLPEGYLMARAILQTAEKTLAGARPSVIHTHMGLPDGWGARLLAHRDPAGTWGGGSSGPGVLSSPPSVPLPPHGRGGEAGSHPFLLSTPLAPRRAPYPGLLPGQPCALG